MIHVQQCLVEKKMGVLLLQNNSRWQMALAPEHVPSRKLQMLIIKDIKTNKTKMYRESQNIVP